MSETTEKMEVAPEESKNNEDLKKLEEDSKGKKRPGEELNFEKAKILRADGAALTIVNTEYMADEFIKKFRKYWDEKDSIRDENVMLIHHPFQLGVLQNFLQDDEMVKNLVSEFNEMKWHRKQMDLYEFYQTLDLCNMKSRFLKGFHDNLKTNVMPWMEQLTGMNLTHVSASCSMYNAGDHLLVHDDLLSDRKIAFVFYLSPWEEQKVWDVKSGGALELFAADENNLPVFPVVEEIYPKNNQLLFFKVCEKSFHQVGEVTTLNYPRLSINGWFHGPIDGRNGENSVVVEDSSYIGPHNDDINLSEWMNSLYLVDDIKKTVQKTIEFSSEACLEEFLIPDIFDVMAENLRTNKDLEWSIKGPAHLRKYEILNLATLKEGPVLDLFKIFSSPSIFKLLYEYTELDLYGQQAESPKCSIEIQRWHTGCYTVLGGSNTYSDSALDLILYFNAKENVGVITYLAPEEEQREQQPGSSSYDDEEDEDDPVLLTIYPKNNSMNIVFFSEGTTKFTKYVSKNVVGRGDGDNDDKFTYILVCSYKE